MFIIYSSLFALINLFILNKILIYKNFLTYNAKKHHHKDKFKKKIILSGGLYFLLSSIVALAFIFDYNSKTIFIIIFNASLFLIIGIFSDINYNLTPRSRLLICFILCLFATQSSGAIVTNVDINFLNKLISHNIIAILFSSFCLLIIINGYNFVDGSHGNVVFYNLSVYFFLLLKNNYNLINIYNNHLFIFLAIISIIFLIYNLCEINFLGDNGAYFLGSITGLLIILYYKNNLLSSMYIINILIYPAFEVLWSIVRKSFKNKKIDQPDKYHLHHLIMSILNKKLKKQINSTLTSLIIFIINLTFMKFASDYPNDKYYQIKILIIYVLFYIISYCYLLKMKKNN